MLKQQPLLCARGAKQGHGPADDAVCVCVPAPRRFYGGTPDLKKAYSMRPGAEADDSYGVIEYGSCGFTHSDGALAYPKDMYAALAGESFRALKAALCMHFLLFHPASRALLVFSCRGALFCIGSSSRGGQDRTDVCSPPPAPSLRQLADAASLNMQTPTGTMEAAAAAAMRCAASLAWCLTRGCQSRPPSFSTWARPTPTSLTAMDASGQVGVRGCRLGFEHCAAPKLRVLGQGLSNRR